MLTELYAITVEGDLGSSEVTVSTAAMMSISVDVMGDTNVSVYNISQHIDLPHI